MVVIILFVPKTTRADEDPRRFKTIEVVYTEYEWWLVYWQDGSQACKLYIDHDQTPTSDEILFQCGEKIYEFWMNSAPCLMAERLVYMP